MTRLARLLTARTAALLTLTGLALIAVGHRIDPKGGPRVH